MNGHTNDQDWQDSYSTVATFPYSWLGKATQLLDAANLALVKETDGPLRGLYRNLSVYMMLTAFALEDIFKAVILFRDRTIISDKKRKDRLFSGHDLRGLALQAQVTCTTGESDLLQRLTQSVFGGRYPIPKDWTQYKGGLNGSGSVPPSVFKLPSDFEAIIAFVHKLETELRNLGVVCDLFDLSYSYSKGGASVSVERRITPHPHDVVDNEAGDKGSK
jgi:hypothetical protein